MIKNYLNYRKSTLYLYLGVIIIFLLVHYLYGFPMNSIGYCILMISFLFLLYAVVDCTKYHLKMKILADINKHLSTDKHLLPKADNNLEQVYQDIISSMYGMVQNHVESMEKAHTEQIEYYTMWVHQIKTPISAMRLALQSNTSASNSELMEQELFKIEQYVELALQYTKMKDLSSDLVIHEYALEDIVNQSIKKYATLFIYKKLSLQINEFHEVVTTDSKWLSFILEQLLSNAIKYTNKGGIQITFDHNTLRITDTGIGIREEDIERIFEKGYTGYNGRVDKKASGIGLYLTKKVADSLAVKVKIISRVGKGTTAMIIFSDHIDFDKQEAYQG